MKNGRQNLLCARDFKKNKHTKTLQNNVLLSIISRMKDKIICLFPGQGAQYSGMCKDVYQEYACVRHVFEMVSDYSHNNMTDMCFKSSDTELMRSDKASLSTFTCSMSMVAIITDYFKRDLSNIFDFAAGHSMGQYTALCASDSVSLKDSVHLLQERSIHAMQISGNNNGMICIIGLNRQKIKRVGLIAYPKYLLFY